MRNIALGVTLLLIGCTKMHVNVLPAPVHCDIPPEQEEVYGPKMPETWPVIEYKESNDVTE